MTDLRPLNATHFRILDAMRHHGSVTPRSFRAPTIDRGDEIDRLAPRIGELREHGYSIETVMEKSSRGKRFARYILRDKPQPTGPSSPKPTLDAGDALFEVPHQPSSAYDEDAA
jgi:hypothetical protein